MDRTLFVSDRYMTDIGFCHFMVDIHDRSTLVPEYDIHAFILENL